MYSQEEKEKAVRHICNEMSKGNSLRQILSTEREDWLPHRDTFLEWVREDDQYSDQYARAREARADFIFEEIFDIADDQEDDVKTVQGKEIVNHNVINRSKLRVDARKWALSKMLPKKYGDKLDVTTAGDKITRSGLKPEDFESIEEYNAYVNAMDRSKRRR